MVKLEIRSRARKTVLRTVFENKQLAIGNWPETGTWYLLFGTWGRALATLCRPDSWNEKKG